MTLPRQPKHIYQTDVFYLSVSRKEIAELTDTRIENVVRILSEFRKDNIIRIEGKKIEVLDMPRLEGIAKFRTPDVIIDNQ